MSKGERVVYRGSAKDQAQPPGPVSYNWLPGKSLMSKGERVMYCESAKDRAEQPGPVSYRSNQSPLDQCRIIGSQGRV